MAATKEQERASALFDSIITTLREPTPDLRRALMECQDACNLLGWKNQERWCQHELYGYPPGVQLPQYRNGLAEVRWQFSDSAYLTMRAVISGETASDDGPKPFTTTFTQGLADLITGAYSHGIAVPTGRTGRRRSRSGDSLIDIAEQYFYPATTYAEIIRQIQRTLYEFALNSRDQLRQYIAQQANTSRQLSAFLRERSSPMPEIPVEIQESLARFQRDHPDPSKVAFIMMQFGKTQDHDSIVGAIKEALTSHGMTALRADDRQYHNMTLPNIMTYIYGCRMGIAVFERIEREQFNPNVALEVGWMFGLRKPVCLLKDKTLQSLQSDLVGNLYRPFDTRDPQSTIPREISGWLKDQDFL